MPGIYCKDCQHFMHGEKLPFSYGPDEQNHKTEVCVAPENYKNTHKKADSELIEKPWCINYFNDCKWFDPISGSSSSSSSGVVVDMPSSSSSSSSSGGI